MKDFEKIYSEYFDTVFQYTLSLCKDEAWAEELTQEAFFKALKNIGTFRGECRLSVWLCQIAKNTFYSEVKRQQRQADYPLDTIPVTENIEQQLLNKETAFELHRLLHRLDDPYKEVFWMRTFGELSFAEIGSLFGKYSRRIKCHLHSHAMAFPVVGCLARKPYSEIHSSHWIHRDTDTAYCSTSWILTSRSHPRSLSHFHVSSYTSAAQKLFPLFCFTFR